MGEVAYFEVASQGLECQPGIADETEGGIIAANLGAVHVKLNIAGALRKERPAVGAILIGARADEEDDVGLADKIAHVVRAAAFAHEVADDAKRKRMGLIDASLPHHGCRNGQRTAQEGQPALGGLMRRP